MNALDILTKFYASLRNFKYLPFWLFTPLRRFIRFLANIILPRILAQPYKWQGHTEKGLIVSLTSFPARIDNVWQVIECMFRQSCRPEKIILWLSREQFPKMEDIPESLRLRENEIFEIRLVEGDIRSHKKYYYVSKEFPNSLIFLVDDDIYYPTDISDKSVKAFKRNSNVVVCNYAYSIKYRKNGICDSYTTWKFCWGTSLRSKNLFFGSGGGTLFRPSSLYKDLTNISLALQLTPSADDIWLNAMCQLSDTKVYVISSGNILPVKQKSKVTLCSVNVGQSMNDKQLESVINYYLEHLNFRLFSRLM